MSPDPAVIARGMSLCWRLRGNNLVTRRERWTIYFGQDHLLAFIGGSIKMRAGQLIVDTNTIRLADGQHIGNSPIITVEFPDSYKYGERLEDLDEDRELGDEDPVLTVL